MITVHDMFPDLSFKTYQGIETSVNEAVKCKRHTIFWVMRFIGCRFCQYDLEQLAQEYGRFSGKNTQVFAVLQSSRESIIGLKGNMEVPFEIICDTKRDFYRTLDVGATATKEERMPKSEEGMARFLAKKKAVEEKRYERKTGEGEAQQLPALFIVGPNRQIEYVHYAANSIDVPELDDMLRLVDSLDKR